MLKLRLQVAPLSSLGLDWSLKATMCGVSRSWLVQVTLAPTGTVMVSGENANLTMVTAVPVDATGAGAVVVSVFVEALLLSLLGAVIGSAIAWVMFNGNTGNTLGANFTQVVFHLTVTPATVVSAIVFACFIGVLGGLFPAVRAARLPVAAALRAG